jgi:predicted Zn finger-like uncharacterized protein
MIVTCPACSTRYLVDPRALGSAGRKVRCAHCSNTWHQQPAEDLPRSLEVGPEMAASAPGAGDLAEGGMGEPALDAFGRRRTRAGRYPPPSVKPSKRQWPAKVGAGLAGLLVIGAIVGILMRESLMMRWPATARLFAAVGLETPSPSAGLALEGIDTRRDVENGVPVIIVEGTVVNTTGVARAVPKIRALLTDKDSNPVQSLIIAPETPVPGGGKVPFHATISQPSNAATGISIAFIDGG